MSVQLRFTHGTYIYIVSVEYFLVNLSQFTRDQTGKSAKIWKTQEDSCS